MCVWCEGGTASLDGFSVETRPAARIAGWRWTGGHADAVSGALAPTLLRVRETILEEQAFAPGPVVVLTLAGEGDRVECFAGARLADGAEAPKGLEEFPVGAGEHALFNHHRSEGDVIERYAALLERVRAEGLARDTSRFRHREEYPLHADFARPETVRLMVPILIGH